MSTNRRTATARLGALCLCLYATLPVPARAERWTLDRALAEAARAQPAAEALRAAARGAEADAAVAAALPPPMWRVGLVNLPVNGRDAFDANADDMTMRMIGIEQPWPSRALREADAGIARARASRLGAEAALSARRREQRAGMAWLDAWLAQRRIELHEAQMALLDQAEATALAAAGEYGDGFQAALQWQSLSAQHALEHVRERQRRDEALARLAAELGVPVAAHELAETLPEWPAPDVAALRAGLPHLPDLERLEAALREAGAERALRAAESRPQWTWMLSYGERMPGLSEMASLELRVRFDGLFGRRRSRLESAAAARAEAAEWRFRERRRRLEADLARALSEHERASEALALIDRRLLPARRRQRDLAEARYAEGTGALAPVFEARYALLELDGERWTSLKSLWRARLRLRRLAGDAAPAYAR